MKTLLLASLLVAACGISRVVAESIPLEKWAEHHAEASKALGEWVKSHPVAAREFFEWDGHHPERSQLFVTWTIEHPKEGIEAYVRVHQGEPFLDRIMERHAPAAREFMAWCRDHAPAARALMEHSRGLEWAGRHLYREYWNLEEPHK